MPATREVTSAAEEPRPVLFVCWIGRGRGQNGVSEASDSRRGGRPAAASWVQQCKAMRLGREARRASSSGWYAGGCPHESGRLFGRGQCARKRKGARGRKVARRRKGWSARWGATSSLPVHDALPSPSRTEGRCAGYKRARDPLTSHSVFKAGIRQTCRGTSTDGDSPARAECRSRYQRARRRRDRRPSAAQSRRRAPWHAAWPARTGARCRA